MRWSLDLVIVLYDVYPSLEAHRVTAGREVFWIFCLPPTASGMELTSTTTPRWRNFTTDSKATRYRNRNYEVIMRYF